MKQVTEAIRKLRVFKTPFYVNGDLPRKYQGGDIFMVDSFDNGAEFLKKINDLLNQKSPKAS